MNSDLDMANLYGLLVICIKKYNSKGSLKYDRFYVIDVYFAKVYRNGPSLHL